MPQVYLDEHLVVAGRRDRPALETNTAIGPEHHRRHLGRSRDPSTGRIGRHRLSGGTRRASACLLNGGLAAAAACARLPSRGVISHSGSSRLL
jgi:hypothetical protein